MQEVSDRNDRQDRDGDNLNCPTLPWVLHASHLSKGGNGADLKRLLAAATKFVLASSFGRALPEASSEIIQKQDDTVACTVFFAKAHGT